MISVRRLSLTPVKGTRLHRVDSVELTPSGARGDRRFFVVDEQGRMVNSKVAGELQTVVASCSDGRLALRFPNGEVVEGPVTTGEAVRARFYSGLLEGQVLDGPWAQALSDHVGRPLRLVEPPDGAVDRGASGGVSLISLASLHRLAAEARASTVDSRRFRMLVEIDGVTANAEDAWVGRAVQVGAATVRFAGHVGRCLITSRDPESGVIDLPTLDLLAAYRSDVPSTEPLPFGIYGEVVSPGAVRVGDRVAPLD